MKRRTLKNWPKVRPAGEGFGVEGTCLMAFPWLWTRRVCRLLFAVLGLWVMAAATVPYWSEWIPRTGWWNQVSWWLHRAMETRLVAAGQNWLHLSEMQADGVCVLLGLQIGAGNKGLAKVLTPLAITVLYPLLSTRMCVLIDK